MSTAVLAAVIAAGTSVVVTAATIWFQQRTAKQESRSEAKQVLDRYRGPLLDSASDLGYRINKIRHDDFLSDLRAGGPGEEPARLTTLFRFAQYLGWCEILRTEVQLLRFDHEVDTRLVAELLGDVQWSLASDSVSGGGMHWIEEQRAVGELMRTRAEPDGPATCLGYAAFSGEYRKTFAPWMDRLAEHVLSEEALVSQRLSLIQWALLGLVVQLDEERTHTNEKWMDQARRELKDAPNLDIPRVECSIRTHVGEVLGDPSIAPRDCLEALTGAT
jgi:hypothetical protein